MVLAVDYAWARPSPAAIKAAGYGAVLRYLSDDSTKNLTVAERDSLLAAGLGIGLIWETSGTRALAGGAAGSADAVQAVRQAKALGLPAGLPLLCNVGDFKAVAGQIPAIAAYYQAWDAGCAGSDYGSGGYATRFIIDQLVANGCHGVWWQNPEDDAGSSGRVVSVNATLYQRVTPTRPAVPAGCDEDVEVDGRHFPWWTPQPGPTPTPTPTPTPAAPGVHYPGDAMTALQGSVRISQGQGWTDAGGCPGLVASKVVSVVPYQSDPETANILAFQGWSADGKLWFTGADGGPYGFTVWQAD